MSPIAGDVILSVGVDTAPAKADLDELKAETGRVSDNWAKARREILHSIRTTMMVMRRAVHIVTDILRQFGITLGPLATALIEAGFAVVSWLLAIEASISAGTFGAAAAAAAIMGGIAIAGTVAAGVLAENALKDQQAAILRNADILEAVGDIFELIGLRD